MKVRQGIAQARDGVSLCYTLHGEANASRRAVLVHSLAMDRHFWDPVAEKLAPDAAVLTYDCRGHGESGKGDLGYSIALFADDLAALMDHVGWERAVAAGASMGGCVGLGFAQRHPGRVGALGLVDTTAWYGEEAPRQWDERARNALDGGLQSLVDFQVTRWFGEEFRAAHPEAVSAAVGVFLRNDPRAYAATCRMLGAADLRPALASIRVPTAVVVGEEDYATPPAMAEALHRNIEGSTLTVLKNARHLTPLERPAEVAAELRSLLGRAA